MAVTQSLKDFQLIEGEKVSSTPDYSCVSPDHSSDYSPEVSSEPTDTLTDQSDRLWSVGELAKRFECSDRTVQKMVKFVEQAYPDAHLKAREGKRSMYTFLCVQYLDSLHQSKERGIDSPQWVADQQLKIQNLELKTTSLPPSPENHPPEPFSSGDGALAMWAPSAMAIAPTPSTGIEVLDGILDDCAEPPVEEVAIESSDQILEAIASLHQQVQSLEAQNEAEAEAIAQQRELLTKSAKALDALGLRKDQAVADKRANQEEAQTVKVAQDELASVLGKLGLL